jgi:hypothetical protein
LVLGTTQSLVPRKYKSRKQKSANEPAAAMQENHVFVLQNKNSYSCSDCSKKRDKKKTSNTSQPSNNNNYAQVVGAHTQQIGVREEKKVKEDD